VAAVAAVAALAPASVPWARRPASTSRRDWPSFRRVSVPTCVEPSCPPCFASTLTPCCACAGLLRHLHPLSTGSEQRRPRGGARWVSQGALALCGKGGAALLWRSRARVPCSTASPASPTARGTPV